MKTPSLPYGHPSTLREGPFECKGSGGGTDPENNYTPEQEAWLREKKLFTGRMIADIAHLPEHLKFL